MKKTPPVVLAILDGWGIGPKDKNINSIEAAKTPFYDDLVKNHPFTQLGATGSDVGLEEGQMSGSETGHLNIGAGRIITQDVKIILESINTGQFFHNPVIFNGLRHAKTHKSDIHLVGLMGHHDSQHAHPDIVFAMLLFFKKMCFTGNVYLHLFTDGRDTGPKEAINIWKDEWKMMLDKAEGAQVATMCGRFYGMDRVKNWDRLQKAYDLMVETRGDRFTKVEEAIEANYEKGNTDEYLEPALLVKKDGRPVGQIKENDSVIFFNFRSDRARQLVKFFSGNGEVKRKDRDFPQDHQHPKNLFCIGMTDFGPDLDLQTAFSSQPVTATLPMALRDKKQLYIAEKEKFAQVTYFINGGYADAIVGEERIMIESPKVRSYAQCPEMAAEQVTDVIVKNINYDIFDVTIANFANTDMVAHTGDFKATVKAVEFVDKQLIEIWNALKKKKGTLIVTADHGNADVMVDLKTGLTFNFHTKNPVPFGIVSEDKDLKKAKLEEGGVLGNIAPTVLDVLRVDKPEEMEKLSLIK